MESRAAGVQTVQDDNAPVATHPLPVENTASEANAPVVIQAGLGELVCEYCLAVVPRHTSNQRFCCDDHRNAYHTRARAEARARNEID